MGANTHLPEPSAPSAVVDGLLPQDEMTSPGHPMTTDPTTPAPKVSRYDWTTVAPWIMWIAADASGDAFGFESKPTFHLASNEWTASGRHVLLSRGDYNPDAHDSLESRPAETPRPSEGAAGGMTREEVLKVLDDAASGAATRAESISGKAWIHQRAANTFAKARATIEALYASLDAAEARAMLAEQRETTERGLKLDMRQELDAEFTRAERNEAANVALRGERDARYWEGYRAGMAFVLGRYANKPAPGMNHFCRGESGSGEWCFRSEVPSVCGYCGEPNDALRIERLREVALDDLAATSDAELLVEAAEDGEDVDAIAERTRSALRARLEAQGVGDLRERELAMLCSTLVQRLRKANPSDPWLEKAWRILGKHGHNSLLRDATELCITCGGKGEVIGTYNPSGDPQDASDMPMDCIDCDATGTAPHPAEANTVVGTTGAQGGES